MDGHGMPTLDGKRKRKIQPIEVIDLSEPESAPDSNSVTGESKQNCPTHSAPIMKKAKARDPEMAMLEAIHTRLKRLKQVNDPRETTLYSLQAFKSLLEHFHKEKKNPEYKGDLNPDRRALSSLIKYRHLINGSDSIAGSVPGVMKGDKFTYRAEMSLISLHRPPLAGIEYMKVHEEEFRHNSGLVLCRRQKRHVSIAVSVVVSDRSDHSPYHNILHTNKIWYKGQGVYNYTEYPGQLRAKDQKAVPGDLALQHSCLLNCPVRVIRTDLGGKFMYDGFYDVKDFWQVEGPNGSTVYEFKLVRKFRGNLTT